MAVPSLLLNISPFHGQLSNVGKFLTPRTYARSASSMENMQNVGTLQTMLHRTNVFQMPNGVTCQGMGRFYVQGGLPWLFIAGSDGNIYYAADPATPPVVLSIANSIPFPAGWTTINPTYFNQYGSFMFVSNGINPPFKISAGLIVSAIGIAGPTVAPTVTDVTGGGGLTEGAYTYLITWQTATQESSPNPGSTYAASSIVAANNDTAVLTLIPQPPASANATYINIYRLGGALSYFTLVAQISVGTTDYYDYFTDAELQGNKLLYSTEAYGGGQQLLADPPLNFQQFITIPAGLIGVRPATDSTVNSPNNFAYMSNPIMPEGWNVNNKIALGPNDGDQILTAAICGSLPVFVKSASTWGLVGNSTVDFVPQRLFPVGTLSALSVVETDAGLTFLSPYGWLIWPGSGKPYVLSDRLNTQIQALPLSVRKTAVAAYLPAIASVMLSFPSANITYRINFSSGEADTIPYSYAQSIVCCQDGDNYNIYGLRQSSQSMIDSWFTSTTGDLGNPYAFPVNWLSDRMIVGDPRYVYPLSHLEAMFDETSSDFTVSVICDNNVAEAQEITIPVSRCQQKGPNAYFLANLQPGTQATDVQIQITGLRSDLPTKVNSIMLFGFPGYFRSNP